MFCESVFRDRSRQQLDKVNLIIKQELGGDIGSKVDKQEGTGVAYKADYFDNPIDRHIDTYEDYMGQGKSFKTNQNVKQQ